MLQKTPPLIPTPRELTLTSDSEAFTFDAGVTIDVGLASLFTARQLHAAIREATGLECSLRKSHESPRDDRGLTLRLDPTIDQDPEGYHLVVTSDGISIAAPTQAGMFYGVQTFRQLLQTYGGRIPCLRISDRPVLPHRGVMLDVSRGKVPTLATMFALADGLAACKYNQLQLYVEHTFDFPSHPDIGAGTDPLTAEDILRLDEYCRERYIELVPNLQSFGHQQRLLSLPRYTHLDEAGWRWSLTPALEDTYRLLDALYADFLPAFSSRWLNVDCDETWDLATGQSKALAAEIGKGRVYLQHILRLRELAARYGRRIMLWADVVHEHPELVALLPDDVVLLDWSYESAEEYPTTEALRRSGRTFWVCPGTSSWNTLFPRLDNAVGNIRNFVRDGVRSGASGMLLTDWGDYGHYQPLSLSWYAYVFGAATAWTGAQTSVENFDAAFAPLFLGLPTGDASVTALRRLGRAVAAPTLGLHNRSMLALALFEDPLAGPVSTDIDPAALQEVEMAAIDAIQAWAAIPDSSLRHDLGFTARLVMFASRKGQHSKRLHAALAALTGDEDGLARLDTEIAALEHDRASLPAVRAEFEAVWLRHARRSEIHKTLDHFDALIHAYDSSLAWLHDQRARYAAEKSIDAERATYSPAPRQNLWEQGLV